MNYCINENFINILQENRATDFLKNPQFLELADQVKFVKESSIEKYEKRSIIKCFLGNESNIAEIKAEIEARIEAEIEAKMRAEKGIQKTADISFPKYNFELSTEKFVDSISGRIRYNKYAVFTTRLSDERNDRGCHWHRKKIQQTLFAIENCPVPLYDSQIVIIVSSPVIEGKKEVNFYNRDNQWIGKIWTEPFKKYIYSDYLNIKFVLSPSVFGVEQPEQTDTFYASQIEMPEGEFNANPIKLIVPEIKSRNMPMQKVFLPMSKRNHKLTMEDINKKLNPKKTLESFK